MLDYGPDLRVIHHPRRRFALVGLQWSVGHDPRPRPSGTQQPVQKSKLSVRRGGSWRLFSLFVLPARFPCDQGRDRRGGPGTWRMGPPRQRRANAHHLQ